MNRTELESIIREVLAETMAQGTECVRAVPLQSVRVTEGDRLDTGHPGDQVWTHDLFSLRESPRLGAGIMEMKQTEFPWELQYDEVDYVISGELTVVHAHGEATAKAGELILIPKGSKIRFRVREFARFLYVTCPADWQNA